MQTPHGQLGLFVIFGAGSEWFWAMAQFVGVSATLLLILRQVTLQRQATAVAAFTAVKEQWDSPHLVAARARVSLSALVGVDERGNAQRAVVTFFEELGLHVRRGVINTDDVWERFSVSTETYWKIMSSAIQKTREVTGDPSWYANFEDLVHRLRHHTVRREMRGWRARTALLLSRRVRHAAIETLPLTAGELRFCELECAKDGIALSLGRGDLHYDGPRAAPAPE